MELAPSFNSYISILLNIHEDHIERYGNMHNYSLIKKKIFQNFNDKKYAIISLDDSLSLSVFQELKNISMELKNKNIHSDYEKLQSLQNVQNELENEYLDLIEKQEKIEKLI